MLLESDATANEDCGHINKNVRLLTDDVVVFKIALLEAPYGGRHCGHWAHKPVAEAGESIHRRNLFQHFVARVLIHRQDRSKILRVDNLRQEETSLNGHTD